MTSTIIHRLSFIDTFVMIAPLLTSHCTRYNLSLLSVTCTRMHTLIQAEFTRQHRREVESNRRQREEIRAQIHELRTKRALLSVEERAHLDGSLNVLYNDCIYCDGSFAVGDLADCRHVLNEISELISKGAQYTNSYSSLSYYMHYMLTMKYRRKHGQEEGLSAYVGAVWEERESEWMRMIFETYRLGLLASPHDLYELHSDKDGLIMLQILLRAVMPSHCPITISLTRKDDPLWPIREYTQVVQHKHFAWNYAFRDEYDLTRPFLRGGLNELLIWCINLYHVCEVPRSVEESADSATSADQTQSKLKLKEKEKEKAKVKIRPSDLISHECLTWLSNAVDPGLLKSSANLTIHEQCEEERFHDRWQQWRIVRLCLEEDDDEMDSAIIPLSLEPTRAATYGTYSVSSVPTSDSSMYTLIEHRIKEKRPPISFESSEPLQEYLMNLTELKFFIHTRMTLTCATLPVHRLDLTMLVLTSNKFRGSFHRTFNDLNPAQKEQRRFIQQLINSFFASRETRVSLRHLLTNGALLKFLRPIDDEIKSPLQQPSYASTSSENINWNDMLQHSQSWRRLFEFIYFDLIRRKETNMIELIHRCISSSNLKPSSSNSISNNDIPSSAHLRDPITHLSPLIYFMKHVRSITGYRLFDLLLNESLRVHSNSIEQVLLCEKDVVGPVVGQTLRSILLRRENVELADHVRELHLSGSQQQQQQHLHLLFHGSAQSLFPDGIIAVFGFLELHDLLRAQQTCHAYQVAMKKILTSSRPSMSTRIADLRKLSRFLTSSSILNQLHPHIESLTLHSLDLPKDMLMQLPTVLSALRSLKLIQTMIEGDPETDQGPRQLSLPYALTHLEWNNFEYAYVTGNPWCVSSRLKEFDDILQVVLASIRTGASVTSPALASAVPSSISSSVSTFSLHTLRVQFPHYTGSRGRLPYEFTPLLFIKSTLQHLHIERLLPSSASGKIHLTYEQIHVLRQLSELRYLECSSLPCAQVGSSDSKGSMLSANRIVELLGGPKSVRDSLRWEVDEHGEFADENLKVNELITAPSEEGDLPYFLPHLTYLYHSHMSERMATAYLPHSLRHLTQLNLRITHDSSYVQTDVDRQAEMKRGMIELQDLRNWGIEIDMNASDYLAVITPPPPTTTVSGAPFDDCSFLHSMPHLRSLSLSWYNYLPPTQGQMKLPVRSKLHSAVASLTHLTSLTLSNLTFSSIDSLIDMIRPMMKLEFVSFIFVELNETTTMTTTTTIPLFSQLDQLIAALPHLANRIKCRTKPSTWGEEE